MLDIQTNKYASIDFTTVLIITVILYWILSKDTEELVNMLERC